jgi:hypothetical protein
MLITFTTEHGHLVIRGEDLRRIEDGPDGQCVAGWVESSGGLVCYAPILGTAAENQARIVAQETAVIAAYEEAQRRAAQQPKARQAVNR